MKIFKSKTKEVKNSSIVKKDDHYLYSTEGEHLADVFVDKETAFKIKNGYAPPEIINFLELKEEDIYLEFDNYRTSDKMDDDTYIVHVYKKQTRNELPYGSFYLQYNRHGGLIFKPYAVDKEISTIIHNKNLKEIVLSFFKNKPDNVRKNKKGILLYGPPGGGKTTELLSILREAEQNKIRCFIVNSNIDTESLIHFKPLLGNEPTVFIFEEITERFRRQTLESMLTFLDGEYSWNNSISIATTNHPKDLPENLVDRPGRFETFIEYGNPNKEQILQLAKKFEYTEDEISCLFNKEFSFDYASFLMSESKKNNTTVKETLSVHTEKRKMLSATFKSKMGIGL